MECPLIKNGFCETYSKYVSTRYCARCSRNPTPTFTLPPMTKMAVNYTKALIGHIANGLKERSIEKQKEYLDICKLCDQMIIKDEKMRCANVKCGCFIETKVKWDSAHCPIGKW